jgi:SAM-dependent methyltransferase
MPTALEPTTVFPLWPDVQLPEDVDESSLRSFLESVQVRGAPPDELRTYCREDFWRFVRTYNLVSGFEGTCLELGANPYFTTMLLREFSNLHLVIANYFGGPRRFGEDGRTMKQTVGYTDFKSGRRVEKTFTSAIFDIESERFPFADGEFDVVLCCEILEHLTTDPLAALREIKRVLRRDGVLVMTTPNVNRLENVVKMVAGVNIYDPYSGYGPHGRHNREYNKHELNLLLTHLGFELDCLESADVKENSPQDHLDWEPLVPLLRHRERDLGQYLFVRAYNRGQAAEKRPSFLFRSYPASEIDAEPHGDTADAD